ncbi:ATP-binding cassette domain-containing protein [Duganella sp. sic0402]|uniref:ATP-binding cassette domain-containing protein n=1 Tax=Duganella sp. sic0402 TaxID=2854786 RepID=UPI001C44FB41|nr:ATP-binding cassette domain-containing protein [Duganella sp. sic0402]
MTTTTPLRNTPDTTLAPGALLRLDRPGLQYAILDGRFEVYALIGDRRVYLMEIAAGQALLSAPATHGCLIALAPEGGTLATMAPPLAGESNSDNGTVAVWHAQLFAAAGLAPATLPVDDPAAALAASHNALLAALSERLTARDEEEAARRARRDAQQADDLATVMEGHERMLEPSAPATDEDDFHYVYRMIGGSAGDLRRQHQASDFADFAATHHLPLRWVSLQGRWWRTDLGPLVAQHDGRCVALLPDWRGHYRLHCRGAAPRAVNATLASALGTGAHAVTLPLPARPLRAHDLLLIGLSLCRADLLTLAAAALLASLLGLLVPIATGAIIDTLVPSQMRGPLLMLGVMLGVGQLCSLLLRLSADVARLRIDGRLAVRLQGGVIDRVLHLPAAVLRRYSSTDLALRALSIDTVRQALTGIALNSVLSGIFGVSAIALLCHYSAAGAGLALLLFAGLIALNVGSGLRQLRNLQNSAQMSASVAGFTQQLMENMATLRVFGAERRAFVQWSRKATQLRKMSLTAQRSNILLSTVLGGYDLLAMALMLLVLGTQDAVLSAGAFLAFAAAYQGFLGASMAFSGAMRQLVQLLPMLDRIKPLLEQAPETAGGMQAPGALAGAIEVANVSFAYPDCPPILNNLSLRIEPGQFVALVGPSGCGKSTLIKLMLGIDQPSQGAIFYDGHNLNELDLAAVRRQIGVCRQNGKLFSGSLFENILGANVGTQEDVWHAAALAGIDAEIRALPMQLHTVVTEGSAAFSGGQIQRLLLARALVGKPRMVILDEATSALDNVTQEHIVRNVERLGVTRIAVAHRLSTVRHADLILFIRDGQVAEAGTFEALLAQDGLFAQFARHQQAELKE